MGRIELYEVLRAHNILHWDHLLLENDIDGEYDEGNDRSNVRTIHFKAVKTYLF